MATATRYLLISSLTKATRKTFATRQQKPYAFMRRQAHKRFFSACLIRRSHGSVARTLTTSFARSKQPLLDGAQPMISAHQLCTCRMGKDPSISVANTSGELYDVKGVWIGDASACPTSLGANPMITIMALAQRTADKMMAALPRRTGIASAAVVGPASPVSERSSTMFCHIIELTAKPGQARRAVEIIGNQAIPTVIQPAEGFVDEIVLLSLSDPNHVTAFSFWQNKDYSDKFDAYGFDAVTVMVQETLAAPP